MNELKPITDKKEEEDEEEEVIKAKEIEAEDEWYKTVSGKDAKMLEEFVMKDYDKDNKPTISIIGDIVYIRNEDHTINLTSRWLKVYKQIAKLDKLPDAVVPSLRQVLILMITKPEWAMKVEDEEEKRRKPTIKHNLVNETETDYKKKLREDKEIKKKMLMRRQTIPPTSEDMAKLAKQTPTKCEKQKKQKKQPKPLPLA